MKKHLYTYTTNNPVNFVDPTGHYHVDPDGNKVLGSGQVIKNPSQPGPSNYGTPSGVSKSKPSTKKTSGSSVKKLIQTGLDYGGYIPGPLGAVADGVNALIYLADGDYKNAALSGMAVLPGGSAAKSGIKAGGALGSVAKGKVKIHKNSNDYVGHQGVYEIKIDGNLHKYGKADMTQISSTGNPKRLQTQINKLQRQNPNSQVSGRVIYENQNISTANIKKVETKAIQGYYDKYKQYPPGNQNHPGVN